jgi:phenylalanyl-tRNA synthetase alpha chain
MRELDDLIAAALARAAAASTLEELEALDAELLGRRSRLAELQRGLSGAPAEERPRLGKALQEARARLTEAIEGRRETLRGEAEGRLLEADRVDVTLERLRLDEGNDHLIQQTIDEVCGIFVGLGYRVAMGPEAELAFYNFDALNTPPTHPSRLESDTLYLDWGNPADEVLLRTHTSPMQARYMQAHEPPVYVVVPGKVYRADTADATHSPVFHQIEGLAVDRHITLSDLKGTLAHFAREFFGAGRRVRLLPHFFPFTEPSAEMAASCFACEGAGPCRVCGGSGWIELMGCGMVDPHVFEAVGYDPGEVTGFAFGMGVERLAQVRHGLSPLRHFFDNDVRVLRQFRGR